jgi:hypothetical protein
MRNAAHPPQGFIPVTGGTEGNSSFLIPHSSFFYGATGRTYVGSLLASSMTVAYVVQKAGDPPAS